jgi:membrane-associated protease RseP (regulator of RpoE activity)
MSLGVFLFILALLVVIMIHEAGHLLVAKAFNFKATQYFLGFGPTLWSFRKGETEYGVKAIPAGGFVKIVGMNPYEEIPPEDLPRAYPNKPKGQRALLLVAGSATHWVVAFLLLLFAAMVIGTPTGKPTTEVAAITPDSPAAASDLQPGDEIIAINDRAVDSWNDVQAFIKNHGGEAATFTVERDGKTEDVSVEIGYALISESGEPVEVAETQEALPPPKAGESETAFLGVGPEQVYETEGLIDAVGTAAGQTWDATVLSFKGIGEVFNTVFNGELWAALTGEGERAPDEGPVGLVGAGRFASDIVSQGAYLQFINMIVIFTIFIGMMNLLPLPPLDGGHLAVVGYEAVTGRRVDVRKLIPVAAAVISFFILLFLAVLYLDIARPIQTNF